MGEPTERFPTGAEWKSRENKDGVTEWTLVRLGGATLPPECRATITHGPQGYYADVADSGVGDASRVSPHNALGYGALLAAEAMARRFRRLARRLAK